jgi:hypothetical protein
MSSLADDVFVTPHISLSLHAKLGGHPVHLENMHAHTPTYAHVLGACTHKRTCTCTRTGGHFCMSVLNQVFLFEPCAPICLFAMFQLSTCCESQGVPAPLKMREIDFCRGTETLAVIVSVDMCALICCRVGAKRVKSMTRSKKQYYKVMQAKRQREVSDIANGILIRHVLCCLKLFC